MIRFSAGECVVVECDTQAGLHKLLAHLGDQWVWDRPTMWTPSRFLLGPAWVLRKLTREGVREA
jgi:hypothetical protein